MRTAVLGSINVDLVAAAPRLPEPGETLSARSFRREAGGKGANQATAAARLGAEVTMFGAVGRDTDGDLALAALRAAGVDVENVRRVGEPTGVALIVTDDRGENQIVVSAGANNAVDAPELVGYDLLISQLEIPLEVVEAAFLTTDAFTVLNASPARELPETLVRRADLIVVNEHEHAARSLGAARRVVVTYGSAGSAFFENGEHRAEVPARPAEVLNSVGAGDAYCAAVALCLAAGMDPLRALATASAVGADAVSDPASQPALRPLRDYEAMA